jgi:hypothetical protein
MEPPTRTAALESLRRVIGDDAYDAWADACLEAKVESRVDLSPAELCTIARVLARRPGVVGAIGTSLRIRCEMYLALARAAS